MSYSVNPKERHRHYTYVMSIVGADTAGVLFLAVAFLALPRDQFQTVAFLTVGAVILLSSMLLAGALWELHLNMNSRLTELLVQTRAAGHGEGIEEERTRGTSKAARAKP
jgi:hypothetical protein